MSTKFDDFDFLTISNEVQQNAPAEFPRQKNRRLLACE